MSWASDSKQCSNVQCLSKYVSKSFKTLEAESIRHFAKDLRKKSIVIVIISILDPSMDFTGMSIT